MSIALLGFAAYQITASTYEYIKTDKPKTNKTMKVKIKGIRELVGARYAFDSSGNLVGVCLDEDIENGVHNTFPMELVEEIYDD